MYGYFQVLEQLHQVRIRQVVMHQEAGVDRMRDPADRGVDGIGVAADAVLRFVQGHRKLVGQQPCRAQARHAAADDGDAAARGHGGQGGTRLRGRKSRR
ncbi:hypothetical protein D3C72_1958950 [compost metagenome]